MKKLLLMICALGALAGCSTNVIAPGAASNPLGGLAQFTLADAQNASKMAKTENTPQSLRRAQCYDYIANTISASSAPFVPGLLTLNETKYTAQGVALNFGEACGGVIPMVVAPL